MPVPAAILVLMSASFVTFAAATVLLAARAARNDHPICRRCGFDLFGKPDSS